MLNKLIIMIYFLDIICVTEYKLKDIIVLDNLVDIIRRKIIKKDINKIVKDELVWQYNKMIKQIREKNKILSNGLAEKIIDRYNK